MKEINIIIQSANDFCSYMYQVLIIDKDNNLILNNKTTSNFKLKVKKNKVYRIIISAPEYFYPSMICTSFFVTNDLNRLNYVFNNRFISIKLKLVDYNNIPIKEGKIKLWQDHIQ